MPIDLVRRLAAIALCALALPAAASAADRSWAQPQIKTVVEAGLLADTVAAFKPQRPLTQRALGAALETLSLSNEEPVDYSYPVVVPGRAVTIRELDAALVGFLGLGDAARSITAALRDAGLQPKAGAGSETVARLLGLRLNHPAAQDMLELGLNDPATRAETAYSLARLLEFSGWEQDSIRSETEAVPAGAERAPAEVLTRAVSFVGYPYVWGGTSEAPQQPFGKPAPGGFDCSGFVWRVFKLEPFAGASALASVLRGRTTFEMSGEVPPAQRIKNVQNLQPGDVIFQGANGPSPSLPRSTMPASTSAVAGSSTPPETAPPSIRSKGGTATGSPGRGGRCAKQASPSRPTSGRGDVVQVVEALVGDTEVVEVRRQRVAGEDPLGSERCAAVRVAVADVDVGLAGEAAALARLAAGRAVRLVAEPDDPAVRPRVEPVRKHLSSTPSRASTGSISSWKPAEITTGSSSASSRSPGRTSTFLTTHRATSSSGVVIARNSSAISSCSVRSTPTRGSSSASNAGSPNSWITCTSESRTVTVPSQSTTSRIAARSRCQTRLWHVPDSCLTRVTAVTSQPLAEEGYRCEVRPASGRLVACLVPRERVLAVVQLGRELRELERVERVAHHRELAGLVQPDRLLREPRVRTVRQARGCSVIEPTSTPFREPKLPET